MSELIVDGYNIIHAWPELAPVIKRGHAEEARRRLITMLAEYAASTGEQVTVVFDAHSRARDHGAGEVIDGVTVLFGSANNSADHVIERRVSEASRRGDSVRVIVATSDRLQRDMVMAMGAAVVGAESLHAMVQDVRAETADQSQRRRREAGFAGRLDNSLDPGTRQRLERLRRGQPADGVVPEGESPPADS